MTTLQLWLAVLTVCTFAGLLAGARRGTTGTLEYGFYGLLVGFHAALVVLLVVWLAGL